MSKRATTEIVATDVMEHPAVRAWRRLRLGGREPARVEVLREGHQKRAVYRLAGVAPQGGAVIAKRCRTATGAIERVIYEEILPLLPITVPHYYGFTEEEDTYCWLFLEDVGVERFSPLNAEHRMLAARWLGLMHTAAAHVTTPARLPDRGPDHYLQHLRSARRTILENLTNPALSTDDVDVLKTIVSQCDALDAGWNQVERCCEHKPSTLVHGDFRRKNVFVRADQAGVGLLPIDWETAGWGVPAADLAPSTHYSGQHVDLTTYWEIVRECWPTLGMSGIQQLLWAGLVFRELASINWASIDLAYEWTKKPLASLRVYHIQLSKVMQASPWAH